MRSQKPPATAHKSCPHVADVAPADIAGHWRLQPVEPLVNTYPNVPRNRGIGTRMRRVIARRWLRPASAALGLRQQLGLAAFLLVLRFQTVGSSDINTTLEWREPSYFEEAMTFPFATAAALLPSRATRRRPREARVRPETISLSVIRPALVRGLTFTVEAGAARPNRRIAHRS